MMKMKCVDQRFSLGFKPRRIDYKRAVNIKKERRLTQIEGNRLNKDGKEIPPIHITFPWFSHVIRVEDELESLRKELNGATINYLEGFKEEDHKRDLETRKNPYELLPQLTIYTLEDVPSEFVRKFAY